MNLRKISIKERSELEPLVVDRMEDLEEGMKTLARQLQTDSGPLDILARDSNGAVVIIELKDEIDDGQLDQGLRYYDWLRSNIAMLSKSFKDIDATQDIRLILIAPEFSDSLKRIAKYVDIDLQLKEYTAVEVNDGEKAIIYKDIDVGKLPESAEILSLEDKINFIKSDKVKEVCKEAIKSLKDIGYEVRPIGSRQWASIWYKNKRFMYIGFRKTFFVCQVEMPDGNWVVKRITTANEWKEIFEKEIKTTINHIDEK